MEQHSEKIEDIEEQNEEKAKKKNKKIKKEIKINPQISFIENFLSMNKNDENKNNKAKKNESNEQKNIRQNNNKYNNIEKNELVKPKVVLKEPNIKNNAKEEFKSIIFEKEYETSKGDSSFMNQKRHIDLTIDMFFEKRKKNEENKLSENKEIILNNNENNNNNNDIIKKPNNYSSKNEEKKTKKEKLDKKGKKECKKLNIDKFQKEGNKKSEDINISFELDENERYNINIDKVKKDYLNLVYVHPLDKNDKFEVIEDKKGEKFYLCTICKKFFNSRYSVREHQWSIHLKPFGEKIQKDLKSQYKNKI